MDGAVGNICKFQVRIVADNAELKKVPDRGSHYLGLGHTLVWTDATRRLSDEALVPW